MYERVEVEPISNPESTDVSRTRDDIDTTNNEKPANAKRSRRKDNTVRRSDATESSNETSGIETGGHSKPDSNELGDDGMHPSDIQVGSKTKKSRKANIEIDKNILSNFFKNI